MQVPVRLHVYGNGTSTLPFGAFDTPVDGTADVSGAIPVTGWAMDDVQVLQVQIYRDPVLSEQGLIYLGDATFVSGARPDVESRLFANAGGGPRRLGLHAADQHAARHSPLGAATGGNGTFKLHAYAIDAEGQAAELGSKTIAANNLTARQAVRDHRYAVAGRHRVGQCLRELRLGHRAERADSRRTDRR